MTLSSYNSQQLYAKLKAAGYTTQFNSALRAFLGDAGYTSALNEAMNEWLGTQGYTGQYSERLDAWATDDFNGVVPTSGPIITSAGSSSPDTYLIGTTQTITAGTASNTGGGVVSYEVRHVAGGVTVSTAAAYAHVAGNDLDTASMEWRAVETGGSNAGATAWQVLSTGTVKYPIPVAAGGLVDQSFSDNTGVQTYDASGDFTGSGLSYSLVAAITGVSVNSGTGVVSFDTDAMSTQTGTSVTVRASNSGGGVDSGFSLAITAGNTAPVITGVPTISGTAIEGQILTATPASVSGTPTPTVSYQWKRGVTNVGTDSATYTLVAADIGSTMTVVQTETNIVNFDTATSAATAAVTGLQVVLTSATFNTSTNELDISVNAPGTIYWMITDNATETAADIIAGTGATDSGSYAVTSGANTDVISYPNVTAGNHYLHIVVDSATSPAPSSVSSTQYTFQLGGDITAPTLSSPTDAKASDTTSTGSVVTNEATGTLYWVQTTSATKPSGPQVKLGQDNTGTAADGASGSQAVSATGTQNISPTGLTASTSYTTHYMHEDAATNQSTVVSASGFTTDAASAGAPAFGAAGTGRDSLNGITPTWPTHSTGDLGILVMTNRGNDSTWTPTDGWTQLYTGTSGGTGSSGRRLQVFYKIATSSSETVTNTGDLGNHLAGQIFTFTGAAAVAVLGSATASSGSSVSITSGTTGGSDRRVAVICAEAGDTLTDQITSWTNANLSGLTDHGGHRTTQGSGGGFDVCSGTIATAGAVGNTTATLATATGNWVGLALEIS